MDARATCTSNDFTDGSASEPAVDVHAAVDVLATTDPRCCSHRELDLLAGAAQRLRGFVAAADSRIARRRHELWTSNADHVGPDDDPNHDDPGAGADHDPGEERPGDEFAGLGDRRSGQDQERDRTRARAGDAMASFESALEAGQIDAAHLDAVAAALARLQDDDAARDEFTSYEADLLRYARSERTDRFRRRCTDLARRISRDHGIAHAERQKRAANIRSWWDRHGMWHLHAQLDPEAGAQVAAAIDAHLDTLRSNEPSRDLTWERLQIESFVELVTSSAAIDARVPEITVLIDHETLRTGRFGPGSTCETSSGAPLPPETARRLACDATLVGIVLGPDGVPIQHGRTRRLASREQRRALRTMYRTCAHPDCAVTFDRCRIHHIVWWDHGGLTDLANLLPLCSRHHHDVHEGGWILTMTPDRVTTWTTPTGTVWYRGDTRDRPAPSASNSPDAPDADQAGVAPSTSPDAGVAVSSTVPPSATCPKPAPPDVAAGTRSPTLLGHDAEPAGP